MPGCIVILNGAPRSGKSSIAGAIQRGSSEPWLNLGVDALAQITPARLMPGIGLRPGGERPDLEPAVQSLYAALYDAIAAQARDGRNVITDVGHHDSYSKPLGILKDCARRLAGLPVLFVGVHCPIDVVLQRRAASGGHYAKASADDPIPEPVRRWQEAVHAHGLYDLEVDTATQTPEQCAQAIAAALGAGLQKQTAFQLLAERP